MAVGTRPLRCRGRRDRRGGSSRGSGSSRELRGARLEVAFCLMMIDSSLVLSYGFMYAYIDVVLHYGTVLINYNIGESFQFTAQTSRRAAVKYLKQYMCINKTAFL